MLKLVGTDPKKNTLDQIVSIKRVPKAIYNKEIDIISKFPIKAFNKHSTFLNNLNQEMYGEAFSIMYRCTRSTKLKDFQFRLLHMALITNKELFLFKISTSDRCTFCKTAKEDIYHTLVHCKFSKRIWAYLQTYMSEKTGITLQFSDNDIILGSNFFPFFQLYNHILLLTKQYLYACRCLAVIPATDVLKTKIEREYQIELSMGKFGNFVDKVIDKWVPIFSR